MLCGFSDYRPLLVAEITCISTDLRLLTLSGLLVIGIISTELHLSKISLYDTCVLKRKQSRPVTVLTDK
jgi:hypothetical protein